MSGETNFQASMEARQMGYDQYHNIAASIDAVPSPVPPNIHGVPTTCVAGSSLWANLPSENGVLFTQGNPGVPTTYATGSSLWAHLPLENDVLFTQGHPGNKSSFLHLSF
ncbi:hypothetical protein ES288_A02G114300v1 [Gossypium darwinii]|uniref:Uncharacterized protein isoform X1 n=2 Tax=Gossypium TaxID=3633 RepID=A0ABM2ZHS5_GOSHI|nr:uncharacterized protein LOC121213521 isoform X1 [Gossypium hirsutum]TYH28058.1 hypothetical protein ES288_A02G114300v1 [Gossypium darwinii]